LEKKICNLVKEITGKTPVKTEQNNLIFRQNQDNIFYKHYTELLHELAHWIVSTFKHHPNLGFEEHYDYVNNQYPQILFHQEMNARFLTYRFMRILCDKNTKEYNYAMYFLSQAIFNEVFENKSYCYSKTRQKKEINITLNKQNLNFIWKELKNIKNNF
jgi:hypothetical protein